MATDNTEQHDSLTLKPSLNFWMTFALIALALAGYGCKTLWDGDWAGQIYIAFGGLWFIVSAAPLVPGSAYLRLSPNGFTRRLYWRDRWISWHDLAAIRVGSDDGYPMIFCRFRDSDSGTRRHRASAYKFMDGHGHDLEELAALMNEWRARARESA